MKVSSPDILPLAVGGWRSALLVPLRDSAGYDDVINFTYGPLPAAAKNRIVS
jgi:hypothetical protein